MIHWNQLGFQTGRNNPVAEGSLLPRLRYPSNRENERALMDLAEAKARTQQEV